MLRVAQAVRIYGVGKTTLWELAKEGKIRVHRLPNSRVTLWPVEELDRVFGVVGDKA
ncbi:MAG: helix-turn-helix transcriptional regulator [Pseudomonadota bacterium]